MGAVPRQGSDSPGPWQGLSLTAAPQALNRTWGEEGEAEERPPGTHAGHWSPLNKASIGTGMTSFIY